jgi:hypothetical protein
VSKRNLKLFIDVQGAYKEFRFHVGSDLPEERVIALFKNAEDAELFLKAKDGAESSDEKTDAHSRKRA